MAYATTPQLREYLGISDGQDDDTLTIALTAAQQMVDDYCERSFAVAGTVASARVYATCDDDLVFIDDASSITLVESDPYVDGSWVTTWTATDWQGEPLNGRLNGASWPYTAIRAIRFYDFPETERAAVRVTATWGWPAVPGVVAQATLLQAARLFKRRDSVLGIAGGPETGLIRVARALDGDVAQLLAPYRKGTAAIGGIA